MVLGAILVVEADTEDDRAAATYSPSGRNHPRSLIQGPPSCVEILGQSAVERLVERFLSAEVEVITILVDSTVALPDFRRLFPNVRVRAVQDVSRAASETLKTYCEQGITYAFISKGNAYAECDLIDLAWFHRGTRRAVTRASDQIGSLDLWIADCAKVEESGFVVDVAHANESDCPSYFISEYVSRLAHPRDIRTFVLDMFNGRCETRPSGRETRPGVWVDDGAQIHKHARIVAPAYLGRGATVLEDTLVTRGSNLESLSYIDYGTVIEDTSVLANSYVGIWLDVAHAVVGGNRLLSLGHNVLLEISDTSLIRSMRRSAKKQGLFPSIPAREQAAFAPPRGVD